MTGWRIGMTVGNAEVTNALMRIKSNVDSGIFQAVQLAGVAALEGPQDIIDHHNGCTRRGAIGSSLPCARWGWRLIRLRRVSTCGQSCRTAVLSGESHLALSRSRTWL